MTIEDEKSITEGVGEVDEEYHQTLLKPTSLIEVANLTEDILFFEEEFYVSASHLNR